MKEEWLLLGGWRRRFLMLFVENLPLKETLLLEFIEFSLSPSLYLCDFNVPLDSSVSRG